MTLQDQLKDYLTQSGTSMRALSLLAGLNPKAVSDILRLKGLAPKRSTLLALEKATGLDLVTLPLETARTYAELMADLLAVQPGDPTHSKSRRLARRVSWLMKQAGWVAETKQVNRQEIVAFFEDSHPATVGVSKGSFATYKSELLSVVDESAGRKRKRGIADVDGLYKEIHETIRNRDFPLYQKNGSGSFFVFLYEQGIEPGDITTDVFQRYYEHRQEHSVKDDAKCRRQTKEMATLLASLACHPDFARYGLVAVPHPFSDGRDRFGVPNEEIASLMAEFDQKVAPWALGKASNSGASMEEFIQHLDTQAAPLQGKKALLCKGKSTSQKVAKRARADELLRLGYLPADKRWNDNTLANRRGYVAAAAKALLADTGYLIETVEELTDPDVVESYADSLTEANAGKEFPSDYVASVLKTIRKVAVGYCGRDPKDVQDISDLIQEFETGRKGIAPRNKAKLQAFTNDRIQRFVDASDEIIRDVNTRASMTKKKFRKKHGKAPDIAKIYDAEMIRDVMAAIAHDILLVRAPRSENLTGIRLDWIQWTGDTARIVVPASQVKLRNAKDADLVIPLNGFASKRLKLFMDKLRPLALAKGDEKNPYLFPGQGGKGSRAGGSYTGLLKRLCRKVARTTGVSINPHLYRHLLGWIWLKEDPGKLPAVQKLLGHKSLQTTLDYYAEVDENLALDQWQEYLDEKRNPKRAA